MREIGFWDYTCPLHGSLEHYTRDDWDELLDDMSAGGFNSLVIGMKWLTTGYRSALPWLDQDQGNAAIASNNDTIHHALAGARRRGIRTWLLVVANNFSTREFGIPPTNPSSGEFRNFASYDLDLPQIEERIVELFADVVENFGNETDGLVVELEFCDHDAPHRIEPYNQWATANNRPDFATIKNIRLEPRSFPFTDWRDYTTSRRIDVLKRIEAQVRGQGFGGTLSALYELANAPFMVQANVNLAMMRDELPHWPVVSYDSIYDRTVNRLGTMAMCVDQPHELGLEVLFLTRGVMTWTWPLDGPPLDLEKQWRMSIEDAERFQPEALWFMGSDARLDGLVCNKTRLPAWGFPDGRTARQRLMEMTARLLEPRA